MLFTTVLAVMAGMQAFAQVSTPGTGVNWNFDSLATHLPTAVTRQSATEYRVSKLVNVSPTDSFIENRPVTVMFDSAATINFSKCVVRLTTTGAGNMITLTANDTVKKFLRIRVDSVMNASFTATQITHGKGMSLIYSTATFEGCNFASNKTTTPDPSGALSLLGSNGIIRNSIFRENSRSGITIGATGASGLRVDSSQFLYNNTDNGNYPQINIGTANDSGIVIRNCNIQGRYARAGAIGFLNITTANYNIHIANNTIYGNRYGIAVTGRGVSGIIANNTIDSNCIENNPLLGGSGLNFQGDSSQHIIVTGNTIRKNLWGVTIQVSSATARSPQISFGRISPVQAADTGRNTFAANGNNSTVYAIYNNSPDTIWAQNNTWDDTTYAGIENTVYHHADSATLGWVIYTPRYIAPVTPPQQVINVSGDESVQVWPNPVSNGGFVQVKTKRDLDSWQIISVNGQLMNSGSMNGRKEMVIPVRDLPPANYYLILQSKDWRKAAPLIVR